MTFLFTEPLSSLYTLINFGSVKRELSASLDKISPDNTEFSRFPAAHEEKINRFIQDELGGTISSLSLVVCADLKEGVSLEGSLSKRALMIFSPKFISTLRNELTPEQKFEIAHEYGHLFHDDGYRGELNIIYLSKLALCTTYVASAIALTALSFSPLSTHMLSCTAAKVAYLCTDIYKSSLRETVADQYAASKSQALKSGGIAYIKNLKISSIDKINTLLAVRNLPHLQSTVTNAIDFFDSLPLAPFPTFGVRLNTIYNERPT